jgi:hypothetical protein
MAAVSSAARTAAASVCSKCFRRAEAQLQVSAEAKAVPARLPRSEARKGQTPRGKSRCAACGRKVAFDGRCGSVLCSEQRYFDRHDCG